MAGIYIHIPFCKQRCHYCDFYTTTQIKRKPELIQALLKELVLKKNWLGDEAIQTIYFGGGTPSLLSKDEITSILETISKYFVLTSQPEITLEANPDDLTNNFLADIADSPINRLSVGIQSFHDADLALMNRRHMSQQAIDCIKSAQDKGFNNISVDLIYGLPSSNPEKWNYNLQMVSGLSIQHLSAYHLTYEKGTVFDVWSNKNKITPISEEDSIYQFKSLLEWAAQQKFIHYEISNFGLPGFLSQHNSSYWQQKKYLGIGPSAHSYNQMQRSWNVSNLSLYLEGIAKGEPFYESETLSETDKFNEFIITSLRTRWGINLHELDLQFGSHNKEELIQKAKPFIENQKIYEHDGSIILTDEGVFVSDLILAELMKTPDGI